MNPPLTVSVIIPAYNAAAFIRAALESALNQTYPPHEIIVVDDGSTDDTAEIVRATDPNIRLLQQPNGGPAAARNAGFAAAAGNLFAQLDADDLWLPSKLERQVALFAADPNLGMVSCGVEQFSEYETIPIDPRYAVLYGRGASGIIFRREVYARVGPLEETSRASESVEWLIRADTLGIQHAVVPEVLVRRRLHPDSRARQNKDIQPQEYLRILRQRLQDKRKPPPET